LAQIIFWIFNRSANLLGLRQRVQSKDNPTYWPRKYKHSKDEDILGI
jgi:hypothetical protein